MYGVSGRWGEARGGGKPEVSLLLRGFFSKPEAVVCVSDGRNVTGSAVLGTYLIESLAGTNFVTSASSDKLCTW